jgi:hypothetical protein
MIVLRASALLIALLAGSSAHADMTPEEINGVARAALAMLHWHECVIDRTKEFAQSSCEPAEILVKASFGECQTQESEFRQVYRDLEPESESSQSSPIGLRG